MVALYNMMDCFRVEMTASIKSITLRTIPRVKMANTRWDEALLNEPLQKEKLTT